MQLENPKPQIFNQKSNLTNQEENERRQQEWNLDIEDPIDSLEIFDIVKTIKDPEHALTLEQLNIITHDDIKVEGKTISVYFTPTIPHCSMAQTIGLTLKIKLQRSLPREYKTKVYIKPGMHYQEIVINKQLQDKERLLAAIENPNLVNIVNHGIKGLR